MALVSRPQSPKRFVEQTYFSLCWKGFFLVYSFLPITRPVQIVDPMGFHLKIKLATRPICRPDGNFPLSKIRDSVKMDLFSGFKVCFLVKLDTNMVTSILFPVSNANLPKKVCLKYKKSFGQTLATLPNCRPDGDFYQN